MSYVLGNKHESLGITEFGNKDSLEARLDYFQGLLDQSFINYIAA